MIGNCMAVGVESRGSFGGERQELQRAGRASLLRLGRFFQDGVNVGSTETKRAYGGATDFRSARKRNELVGNQKWAGGEINFGVEVFEVQGRRNLFVIENESRLDKARNSGGVGRMSNVAFDGADVAELLFVGLAFENLSQRFDFDGVAHRSAGTMRFDIADSFQRNVSVGLGHGNRFGLSVDARREERGGTRAIVVLSGAAEHGIDGVAIGESVGKALEHNHARAVAEHGSGCVGVKWTAVAVFGEGAAFLIEETAFLRNGDVNATGKSDVAFVVE